MPVPRFRGREERKPAQPMYPRDEDDDDDHFEEFHEDQPSPAPIQITMTFPQAQATAGLQAAQGPIETVVVTLPPPPPRPEGGRGGSGISQTTEHLLIAAGSIGATIIIVMILLAIHTMRKRGLTLAEAVKQGKYQVTGRDPPLPPPKSNGITWDNKPAYGSDYGSMRDKTVTPPPAASLARSATFSSQRPLMELNRSESFNQTAITERSISPGTVPQSFLLDSPPRRNNTNNSHKRDISATPSSPVLPLQNPPHSASTRNTRSISELSELQYPEAVQEVQEQSSLSPLRPPPTFKQFLFNRPSVSGRPGPTGVSRFSWTNSNAPQTPHDPSRDTGTHMIGRDSFMTQRSSVPRFRTVDSWVDQQTNRIEEQKLKDQFRNTQMSQLSTASEEMEERDTVPEVPLLPKNVTGLRDGAKIPMPASPAPLRSAGLPGKNVKHERHDTHTTVDTAPIFRQHPGTEVRFSTRSAVPSEILDMGSKPNIMS